MQTRRTLPRRRGGGRARRARPARRCRGEQRRLSCSAQGLRARRARAARLAGSAGRPARPLERSPASQTPPPPNCPPISPAARARPPRAPAPLGCRPTAAVLPTRCLHLRAAREPQARGGSTGPAVQRPGCRCESVEICRCARQESAPVTPHPHPHPRPNAHGRPRCRRQVRGVRLRNREGRALARVSGTRARGSRGFLPRGGAEGTRGRGGALLGRQPNRHGPPGRSRCAPGCAPGGRPAPRVGGRGRIMLQTSAPRRPRCRARARTRTPPAAASSPAVPAALPRTIPRGRLSRAARRASGAPSRPDPDRSRAAGAGGDREEGRGGRERNRAGSQMRPFMDSVCPTA